MSCITHSMLYNYHSQNKKKIVKTLHRLSLFEQSPKYVGNHYSITYPNTSEQYTHLIKKLY